MKLYKVDAIVLRSIECGNGDKLLVIFSREHGKMKVMAHGVTKPSSRKRGSVQPFTYTKFLIHRGRELDSVSQCEGIEMFPFLRADLGIISYASYLAELVQCLIPEGEQNEPLFRLLLETMRLMKEREAEILTRSFELKAAGLMGYLPVLEACAHCGEPPAGSLFFSAETGGVLCEACGAGDPRAVPVSRGMVETLKALLNWPQDRLRQLKISPADRKRIKTLLYDYLKYYLERDLKSASFINRFAEEP
ncbi:DNA repair protein RecO [Pelotomaculum propionicicum]|uniref:DNA repair protein RecO n=1 Tax=Pelotomaculum propionicicum TaxID=258475 RepID=UPI003B7E59B6